MINAIVGRPRSGKSYESVVYHIIPAVSSRRKVITNIPLNVDWFVRIYGEEVRALIVVRPYDFAGYGSIRPFSTPEEYADEWRNEKGQGALYVIDEAHMSLPSGRTPVPVCEWYSMHGHYGVDILLLTQSLNKLNRDIRDMIEIVYSTTKNTVMGSDTTYIKKVRAGYRGEVMNEEIRKYKPEYFTAYKSHTQSKDSVAEASANDIKPIWSHWSFKGAALCGLFFVGFVLYQLLKSDDKPQELVTETPLAKLHWEQPEKPKSKPIKTSTKIDQEQPKPPKPEHPYNAYDLHIKARIFGMFNGKLKDVLLLTVSQNGQPIFSIDGNDLIKAGYKYNLLNDCLLELTYNGEFIGHKTCDLPQIGPSMMATR